MKVQVIKLSIYENEDIMLIAPKEMLYDFLTSLSCMISEAARYNRIEGYKNTADKYREFSKQITIRRNEMMNEE